MATLALCNMKILLGGGDYTLTDWMRVVLIGQAWTCLSLEADSSGIQVEPQAKEMDTVSWKASL